MKKFMILENEQECTLISSPERPDSEIKIIRIPSEEFKEYLDHYPAISAPLDDADVSLNRNTIQPCHDCIFIKQDGYYRKCLFSDILWVESARSYCYINLKNNKKIVITQSSLKIAEIVPGNIFIRIHRTFIVNKKYVDSYIGNMLYIGKQSFPISRQYKDDVLACFNLFTPSKTPAGKK